MIREDIQTLQEKTLLIVDDDVTLLRSLVLLFERAGACVVTAVDGREGMQVFFQARPDLVVLDVNMPEMDGWEVCRQIRLMANTPIIMLTTLDREESIIRGLDLGADDFISKPFSAGVLLARVRATLRRADEKAGRLTTSYSDEYLSVDVAQRRVLVRGENVKLTAREFDLLHYLLENSGRVLTHAQILEKIWGWEYRDNVDYVHVYVSNLRRKLEEDARNPRYLITEHGVGYRFEKPPVG